MDSSFNLIVTPIESTGPISSNIPYFKDIISIRFIYTNSTFSSTSNINRNPIIDNYFMFPSAILCNFNAHATMDPYFNLYDIFRNVPTRILDTVLYRMRDCAKEMVASNVEGRDILEMKVSLHVNSDIVEEYPFEQRHRNFNDQQNEDLLEELEDDDLLHELEENELLLELQEDHFEQNPHNYNDQQSLDLPDQLEDNDDLLEELEEEDRFEQYLRNYNDQQSVDLLEELEDDDFLHEQYPHISNDQQNVDLLDQLEDDDLLEELEEDDSLQELEEDHFEHNYNDQQNVDLLDQMEDDDFLQELEGYHFGEYPHNYIDLQNMDLLDQLEDDDLLEELEDHFEQYLHDDNDQQNDDLLEEWSDDDLLEELEDDSISSNSIDRCSICLKKYGSEKELFQTKCSHVFHKKCISKWIDCSSSYSCPLCRREIK